MTRATVISDASFYQGSRLDLRQGIVRGPFAGWAAWVRVDNKPEAVKGFGVLKKCDTSAEAEVYAVLNGVWLAARAGAKIILVRTDCMAVIHLIEGKTRAERMLSIWDDAFAREDMKGLTVSGRHVKGHGQINNAASYVNDWCDKHAGIAMRKSRRGDYGRSDGNRQGSASSGLA